MFGATETSWLVPLSNNGVLQLIVVFAGVILPIAIYFIVHAWTKVRQSEQRAQLVHSMLQRGFSSEQIARVLIASQLLAEESEKKPSDVDEARSDPEVRAVKTLTAWSYEADDVQRILAAARVNGRLDEPTYAIIKTLAESWAETESIISVLESRQSRGPRIAASHSA